MTDCALCEIPSREEEQGRIIHDTGLVYSIMNFEPLHQGHVMVIPRRHARLGSLTHAENYEFSLELLHLTNRLLELYPSEPPITWSVSDTPHASIPGHFHYHIAPSAAGMRDLMAGYYPKVSFRQRAHLEYLEQMAVRLR